MSLDKKIAAIDRIAHRVSVQNKIPHDKARKIVIKHIVRAENKKQS